MAFLRAVQIFEPFGGIDQAGVNAQFLPGARTRQERKKQRQIIQCWNEALNAHQSHVNGRQAGYHAAIAFIGDQAKRAGFRHAEIGPRDADIGG